MSTFHSRLWQYVSSLRRETIETEARVMERQTDGEIVAKLVEDIALVFVCAVATKTTTLRLLACIIGAGHLYGAWRYASEMYRRDASYRAKRHLYGTWVDEIR